MQALRVRINGDVTSFRYPHFVQGVHLTYEMPPPATIYGHVCSAVGEPIPPESLRFAYHFTHAGKFFDYEHLHFYGKNKHVMNPFRRELLFRPRLTLYLDVLRSDIIRLDELADCFMHPYYAAVLGRSQDLMIFEAIDIVELVESERGFYNGTLLNLDDAARIGGRFFAVTMPRFIDEERRPQWAQYAVLPDSEKPPVSDHALQMEGQKQTLWSDPDAPYVLDESLKRVVVWHEWV